MAQFEKHFVQDLTQDIKIRQCGTIVFNADNLSNVVSVDLYNGQVPASVSGTVVGAVIAPDGATVPVDNGTISGNTVSITLTNACFALPGNIGVGIQVVTGAVATTVLKAIYNVEPFNTDTIVDPDSRITLSLAEIEAKLDEIPTILANAQTAIDGIEAQKDTMIASIASVAGQGTDTTLTQSGVAADAKATGDQITDLKSAFGNITYIWEDGKKAASDSGLILTDANYSITTIPVAMNSSIAGFTRANGVYGGICFYDVYGAFISGSYNSSGNDWNYNIEVPDGAAVVKISCLTADKNTRFVYNQNGLAASAAATTQQTLQDYTITQRRFTTKNALNEYISDCKVTIKNTAVKKLLLAVYAYSNGTMRFYKYDANGDRTATIISKANYFDEASKLLIYADNDIDVKMVIDWGSITELMEGYYTAYSMQESALFDAQEYPNDRHITVAPAENVITLTQLMALRNAIGGAMLSDEYVIDVFNGLNGYHIIRLYVNNSVAAQGTFLDGVPGIVKLGNYGEMYFDPTYLTGNYYGKTELANVGSTDNEFLRLYKEQKHIFYCGASRDLETLKSGIEAATQYMDSTLYVDAGTYDLVDEFGEAYFEALTSANTMSGLQLKNRIHVIFSPDSKVVCHYSGNNQYALSLFSPFNAGEYGFTLENLTLECSRCRYGLHDERNGATGNYKSHLINCHIVFDNTAENPSWAYGSCIGGGFGSNAEVIIENCVLEKVAESSAVGYYHQSNNASISNHAFVFVFKNNYTKNGSFRIEATRTDAALDSTVIATGNNLDGSDFGTYGITGTHVNVYVWNNTVRD